MRFNVKAMAITTCFIWGGAVFLVLLVNWLQITIGDVPTLDLAYGSSFLNVLDSLYPGYTTGGGWPSVIVGTLYAALDGAIGGALIAWLYNKVLDRTTSTT